MIFSVTKGSAKNATSEVGRRQGPSSAVECGGQQRAIRVGLQDPHFDAVARRAHAEMVAHVHAR